MKPHSTLYEVLEVSPRASSLVIRAAYRYLAQFNHPDKQPGARDACERLTQINHAYSVLSDPELRRRYDQAMQRVRPELERRGSGLQISTHPRAADAQESSRPFAFRPLR